MAERGGFEPPVLFWSTHDFQSCTFNRSVTSPFGILNLGRRALVFFKAQCLQNVSTRDLAIRELSQGFSTSKNELPY
jgi:hypothetical protein